MDYYERETHANSDGSPLFCADIDKDNETEIKSLLEEKWNCTIKPFGKLCPVDFYALRDNRICAVIELKTRSHKHNKYNDVFLNLRKWFCLMLSENRLGCPALFVVKFIDKIGYVRVGQIDVKNISLGGCSRVVKSNTDIEPVINVPIANFVWI